MQLLLASLDRYVFDAKRRATGLPSRETGTACRSDNRRDRKTISAREIALSMCHGSKSSNACARAFKPRLRVFSVVM